MEEARAQGYGRTEEARATQTGTKCCYCTRSSVKVEFGIVIHPVCTCTHNLHLLHSYTQICTCTCPYRKVLWYSEKP